MTNQCEWCGHDHPVTALCTKRPTWSRRGFLQLAGAAIVGAALPDLRGERYPTDDLPEKLIGAYHFHEGLRLWFVTLDCVA